MPVPALTTPAPYASLPGLLARAAPGGICGYVSGDPNRPVTCPGTSTCIYSGVGDYHWGCCDQLTCWDPGTCENEGEAYCGGVNSANCVYSQILQCSGASPSCVTYVRSSSYGGTKQTSWACGTAEAMIGVLAVTTTGVSGGSSVVRTTSVGSDGLTSVAKSTGDSSSRDQPNAAGSSATSSIMISSSTRSSTSASISTNTSTGTPVATASPSPTGSSGLSTSEKIGLGVGIPGPIIALAGLVVTIWQCRRQREKKKKNQRADGGGDSNVQLGNMNGVHSSYTNGNQNWAGNNWTFNFGDSSAGGRR